MSFSTRSATPPLVRDFRDWLHANGGYIHELARFVEVPSGFVVEAAETIDVGVVARCPIGLVISNASATQSISQLLSINPSELDAWSSRQLISTFICLHWIADPSSHLTHLPYVRLLPSQEKLRTALHFTELERELFRGTNMYGAIHDREKDWQAEWEVCHGMLADKNPSWAQDFTWPRFMTAASYLSSRAFPSSLLSATPTLAHSPSTEPILLPGVDIFNHARGQPVSWSTSSDSSISLVLRTATKAGQEIFNNYGAKPNSEFILGYGFSISDNPEDTIVLKVAGGAEQATKRWEVGRGARDVEGLWLELLSLVRGGSQEEPTYEDILDAAGALEEMTQSLLDRLPNFEHFHQDVRPEVQDMARNYVKGQRDVLLSIKEYADGKTNEAVQLAKARGIELVFEDE